MTGERSPTILFLLCLVRPLLSFFVFIVLWPQTKRKRNVRERLFLSYFLGVDLTIRFPLSFVWSGRPENVKKGKDTGQAAHNWPLISS